MRWLENVVECWFTVVLPELEDDLPEQKVILPGLKVDSPGIFYEGVSHNM